MATLKETAQVYEPQTILNIADLPEVLISSEVFRTTKKNAEGEEYEIEFIKVDGKDYRIPGPVIEEIKKMLGLKSTITKVKVNKSGSGTATRYKVDALD